MNGSSKLAIHLALTKGISCNGKKIIFLKNVSNKRIFKRAIHIGEEEQDRQ